VKDNRAISAYSHYIKFARIGTLLSSGERSDIKLSNHQSFRPVKTNRTDDLIAFCNSDHYVIWRSVNRSHPPHKPTRKL
jgi:hypothetical protein